MMLLTIEHTTAGYYLGTLTEGDTSVKLSVHFNRHRKMARGVRFSFAARGRHGDDAAAYIRLDQVQRLVNAMRDRIRKDFPDAGGVETRTGKTDHPAE